MSTTGSTSLKKRISPYRRQDQLTQRLLLALQEKSKLENDSTNETGPPVTSSPCISSSDTPIDVLTAWKEISSIFPLISYGEESKQLMFALMGFDLSSQSNIDDQVLLSGFDALLHDMLRVRRYWSQQQNETLSDIKIEESSTKKQKISSTQSAIVASSKSSSEVTNQEASALLPWNVVLRVAIRCATMVTKEIQSKRDIKTVSFKDSKTESTQLAGEVNLAEDRPRNEEEKEKSSVGGMQINDICIELHKYDLDNKGKKNELVERLRQHSDEEHNEKSDIDVKRVSPLLQSLDIAIAELNIMLRTEHNRCLSDVQQKNQTPMISDSNRLSTVETQEERPGTISMNDSNMKQPSLISQPLKQVVPIVNDKMVFDWKNKLYCGPSRYALLKDVDFLVCSLDLKMLNTSVDELKEKVDTIIEYLDQFVGFECNNRSITFRKTLADKLSVNELSAYSECTPVGKRSVTKLPDRGSLFCVSPTSSTFQRFSMNSLLKSSGLSLIEITRARVSRAIQIEKETRKKAMSHRAEKDMPNLQDLMPQIEPVGEIYCNEDDDDIGRLEDAYRMALAFSGGLQNESDCDVIKYRLELLAQQVNGNGSKENEKGGNLDGTADSYLRLLLREVLRPSDSSVWIKLMKESKGTETSMLLRRGRSSLASFLIESRVPGWNNEHELDSSPLPDYLGYLSARGDEVKGDSQQHAMLVRSSFLLPCVDDNTTKLPAPPVVTEIGLGNCISNFLEKKGSSSNAGVDFVFSRKGSFAQPDPTFDSISIALPNISELSKDLFDLILRLAANDDKEHENKPFPLRLATLSASESLKLVLDVVSDYSHWLEPRSVCRRYKYIMELIVKSFGNVGSARNNNDNTASWRMRASSLIRIAKTSENLARIAIYATQFMLILSSKKKEPGKLSHPLYHRMHLEKFSHFWNQIEQGESSNGAPNVMARVFDFTFCTTYLLPLSHQCSLSLGRLTGFPPEIDKCSSLKQETEQLVTLITILCSIFRLIQNDDLLVACIHVGWAIEVLSLSIGFFIKCDGLSLAQPASTHSPWHQAYYQLTKLYDDVWAFSRGDFQKHGSLSSSKTSFICIESELDTKRTSVMPSPKVLIASLVNFAGLNEKAEVGADWCNFVSSFLLDQYAAVLSDGSVASFWIISLCSILQRTIIQQKILEYSKFKDTLSSQRTDQEDDVATEQMLENMMNPFLKRLHCTIVTQHGIRTPPLSKSSKEHSTIAFVFSNLYKEESTKILIKPSHFKTRKWHVYRACIEKVFVSTPPNALFTTLGSKSLRTSSANAFREVYDQFGQTYLRFIMVAAGLAVNESLNMLRYTNDSKIQIVCDAFTSQCKDCITDSFSRTTSKTPSKDFTSEFYDFVNGVGRYLLSHAAADGLIWWNKLISDISALFITNKGTSYGPIANASSNNDLASKRGKDVARIFSSLEEDLSAISQSAYYSVS